MSDINTRITLLIEERGSIHKQMGPLQNRLIAIHDELKPLLELRDQEIIKGMATPDWAQCLTVNETDGSMAMHRYWETQVTKHFEMYRSGYWTDTVEQIIKVKVGKKGAGVKQNIRGIKTFLPLMKPHEDDGRVWFGVFEHTCSERGILGFEILPDSSKCWVTKTSYGRKSDLAKFDTIEAGIEFIRQFHWYGEGDDDNDEEENA